MSTSLKVAVLGAGNGGQAMGGWLASCGCDVRITDLFPEYLSSLQGLKDIELSGVVRAKGGFTVFEDQAECVRGANLIVMVTAAPGHKRIIEKIAPALEDGQVLITSPGYFSSLTIPIYLKRLGLEPKLVYVETESLIYACRAVKPGKVLIHYVKNEMGIGVKPQKEAGRVLDMVRPFYPQLKDQGNIFRVALDNVNFVLHPSILLLNSGWAENTRGNWIFYKEGVSPGVIRVVTDIDAERLSIGKAAGLKLTPVYELLKKFYTVPGQNDLISLLQHNPAYQNIKAPPVLDYRYFNEDICYGLIPMVGLSRIFGLNTPVMDSIIQLVSTLLGKDLRKAGLQLTDLGLDGIEQQALTRIMQGAK
jgi:opine dehydrogenase